MNILQQFGWCGCLIFMWMLTFGKTEMVSEKCNNSSTRKAVRLTEKQVTECVLCLTQPHQVLLVKSKKLECISCMKVPHTDTGKLFALHVIFATEYCACEFISARYTSDLVSCDNEKLPVHLFYAWTRNKCLKPEEFLKSWKTEYSQEQDIILTPKLKLVHSEVILAQNQSKFYPDIPMPVEENILINSHQPEMNATTVRNGLKLKIENSSLSVANGTLDTINLPPPDQIINAPLLPNTSDPDNSDLLLISCVGVSFLIGIFATLGFQWGRKIYRRLARA